MTAKQAETDDELGFEQALTELEGIVSELEDGTLDLDAAILRFERGLGLLKTCRSRLDAAQLRVRDLLAEGATEPAP